VKSVYALRKFTFAGDVASPRLTVLPLKLTSLFSCGTALDSTPSHERDEAEFEAAAAPEFELDLPGLSGDVEPLLPGDRGVMGVVTELLFGQAPDTASEELLTERKEQAFRTIEVAIEHCITPMRVEAEG
jgi:hypothetical protein